MKTFNGDLVKLFNISIEDSRNEVDYITLNNAAMKVGYIVHPKACNKATNEFIQSISGNVNSTFYKTWEDITSKTRFELFIDQMLHYLTTYGTGFALEGNGYVPNETPVGPVYISVFKDYKEIMPCTEEDVYNRCIDMLTSGIAMKQNTIETVVDYVVEYVKMNKLLASDEFDIDVIANREAMTLLCDELDITPNKKFDLFRYIMYKTTGSTLIIKNTATINAIKSSNTQFDFTTLSEKQLIGLASIFYRFKPLFLAFKKTFKRNCYYSTSVTSINATVINKIRRMALKYHTPLAESVMANMLNKVYDSTVLIENITKMNTFQIIRLMNTIIERVDHKDEKTMYIIRNGKMFVKDGKSYHGMINYYATVFNILQDELVSRLSEKATYVKYPKNMVLACPTSEKNFVGDLPFGTYMDLKDSDSFVGIYWREEWGTRDFDLSVLDLNGRKIGWDSIYYSENQDVVYSGDMTSARPEATEIMLFKKGAPDGSVMVNRYNGRNGSKFRFFGGVEPNMKPRLNYMVDPNFIKFSADVVSDTTQQTIGLLNDGKFYVMALGSGNSIVSYQKGSTQNERYYATVLKAKSYLKLTEVLSKAGFIDVDSVDELPEDTQVLDLTQISRDTLINLFS